MKGVLSVFRVWHRIVVLGGVRYCLQADCNQRNAWPGCARALPSSAESRTNS